MKQQDTHTPIEKFTQAHWNKLVELEEALVAQTLPLASAPALVADLVDAGLLEASTPSPKLTERGWEVVSRVRRWRAEHGVSPFVVSVCGSCSRVRYGELGVCPCKDSEEDA